MLEQVAGALASAHRQGVVHRDIKPGNILLDEVGNAYLGDFGIAKELSSGPQPTPEGAAASTLDYVSPEQILGEPVTPQTDVYSLGAVLYETLTGEKPFAGAARGQAALQPAARADSPRRGLPAGHPRAGRCESCKKQPPSNRPRAMPPRWKWPPLSAALSDGGTVYPAGDTKGFPPHWKSQPLQGPASLPGSDAEHFFGREALVQQLVARFAPAANGQDNRFLAVVGPSGSGKSSVVKAGLIPALRDGALPGSEKWFITEMVPGTSPLKSWSWRCGAWPSTRRRTSSRRCSATAGASCAPSAASYR
jgi:hypothetical protein